MGLVLLYQVVLQQQGVCFGVHHRELGICYLGNEESRLDIQSFRRHEILRHPLVQILGLAYIDDFPRGIVIAIHPRGMWKQGNLFPD